MYVLQAYLSNLLNDLVVVVAHVNLIELCYFSNVQFLGVQ